MPVVVVVASVWFARAAYNRAARFERRQGTAPWGGSPMLWGLVGLLFGLLGYLVLALAEKNTKKQVQANAMWSAPAYVQSGRNARTAATGQWGPPPTQWSPPPPPGPPGPPRPNVGGSDFLPGRR